jgi:hypothetical protein
VFARVRVARSPVAGLVALTVWRQMPRRTTFGPPPFPIPSNVGPVFSGRITRRLKNGTRAPKNEGSVS